MLNKPIQQSTTTFPNRGWSSYFTCAAKAMALLGGVGMMGVGISRYFRTEKQSVDLIGFNQ